MEEIILNYIELGLSRLDILSIASGIFLAGFIRGFVGFGASIIIVLVLSFILGPHEAVPIAALSGLPSMLQLLPCLLYTSDAADE